MANIPFKSITFPGLPNKYTVPEISNDLMTAGKAADAKATGDALSALEDAVTEETDKLKADLDSVDVIINGGSSAREVVYDASTLDTITGTVNSSGTWASPTNTAYITALIKESPSTLVVNALSTKESYVSFLRSIPVQPTSTGVEVDFCNGETGRHVVSAGGSETFTVPSDCVCIAITKKSSTNYFPSMVKGIFSSSSETGIVGQVEAIEGNVETLTSTVDTHDTEIEKIRVEEDTEVSFTSGKYITTSGDTINVNSKTTDSGYQYAVVECVEGEQFVVTGTGGNAPRLWAFAGSDNSVIDKSASSASASNLLLTAPEGTAYVVFNAHNYDPCEIVKKGKVGAVYQAIDERVAKAQGVSNAGKYLSVGSDGNVNLTRPSFNADNSYDGYLLTLNSGEAIPVGDSALSYADFISQTWDTLLSAFPNEVTKTTIINDSSNTYPIYKYVFAPAYYQKTVFLTAGMHGDEYEGFWGLYRLMHLIWTEGYKYPSLRKLRHNTRFIIIPVLNPYGVQNKQRKNSQNIDANQNYDVRWSDSDYTHTGSAPFSSNEAKAVKLVCDDYEGEIDYHADFHTDPYGYAKGLYIEADGNSPTFPTAYGLTLDSRQKLIDEYNYAYPSQQTFVVWENTVSSIFRYMEEVRAIPSNIIEVGVGGFATTGTANVMKTGVEWYADVVTNMLAENLVVN